MKILFIQILVFMAVYSTIIFTFILLYTKFDKIKKCFHFHNYSKPIYSKYVSFHVRDIIYECRCGKRKSKRTERTFSSTFPIETNICVGDEEFKRILNGENF